MSDATEAQCSMYVTLDAHTDGPLPRGTRQTTYVEETRRRLSRIRITAEILNKHLVSLLKWIDPHVVVPYLIQNNLLTWDEANIVTNSNFSPRERVMKLVGFIIRKGSQAPQIFAECLWESSQEEGNPGHADCVHLLTAEHDVNADHSDKLQKERICIMQEKFANLVRKILHEFRQQQIDFKEFKVYVANLPASEDVPADTILRSDKTKITWRAREIGSIFEILSHYWSYDNLHLLHCIVKRFGNPETVAMLEEYHQLLQNFQSNPHYLPPKSPLPAKKPIRSLKLSQKYADLVTRVLKGFGELEVDLHKFQVFASKLPVEYGEISGTSLQAIAEAPNPVSVFTLLTPYCDWQNFHPICCMVERFGTAEMVQMVHQYCEEFKELDSGHQLLEYEKYVLHLKTQFANFIVDAIDQLECGTDLTRFQNFLAALPISLKHPQIKMLGQKAFEANQNWGLTFLQFDHCYDFINTALLQDIVEEFHLADLARRLEAYCKEISTFLSDTPSSELMKLLPSKQPPAQPGFAKLSLTFASADTEHNLNRLMQILTNNFSLLRYAVVVHSVCTTKENCFTLNCYVPSMAGSLIIRESSDETLSHFYQKYSVTHLELEEKKQYFFSYNLEKGAQYMVSVARLTKGLDCKLRELNRMIVHAESDTVEEDGITI